MRDPSLLGVGPDSLAARPPDSSRPSPLGRGALKDFSHCSSRCSSCASSPQPDTARSPTKLFGPAILSPEFSVMEKLAEAQAGAEVARHSEAGLQAALLAMRQEHEAALATLAGALREADEHVLGAREAEDRRRRQSVGELTLATAALHAQAQAQAQAEERVVAAQGAAADAGRRATAAEAVAGAAAEKAWAMKEVAQALALMWRGLRLMSAASSQSISKCAPRCRTSLRLAMWCCCSASSLHYWCLTLNSAC